MGSFFTTDDAKRRGETRGVSVGGIRNEKGIKTKSQPSSRDPKKQEPRASGGGLRVVWAQESRHLGKGGAKSGFERLSSE